LVLRLEDWRLVPRAWRVSLPGRIRATAVNRSGTPRDHLRCNVPARNGVEAHRLRLWSGNPIRRSPVNADGSPWHILVARKPWLGTLKVREWAVPPSRMAASGLRSIRDLMRRHPHRV